MVENDDMEIFPVSTSLMGGLSVVVLYWLHLFLVEQSMPSTGGVSLTVFLAAFFSQYIPLRIVQSNLDL